MTNLPSGHSGPARILGESAAAERIRAFARRAAAIDAPVLITGETGTGKGLLARAVHEASSRARRAFVAVNCAGVAETLFESSFFGHARGAFTGAREAHRGFFEQAHGGTLFLDEVGELAPVFQAKLLTALEDGRVRRLGAERAVPVDIRVLAATGVQLHDAMAAGQFRRDLYHRLCVLPFHLPPLRERPEDIRFFARHFLRHFSHRYGRAVSGFGPGVLDRLADYAWPGNIRELAHAVEAAVVACDGAHVRVRDLSVDIRRGAVDPVPAGPTRELRPPPRRRYSFFGPPEEERRLILDALRRCRGNKTRAARALGMARNTLRQKLRELGLPSDAPSRAAD